jgi:hypothetical protein
MKFLPYERLKINTALNREEVLKRLNNAIDPKRHFRLFGLGIKPYQGSVEGSHFKISQIALRSLLLPRIKGDVQSQLNGCSVYMSIQPHILVTAFLIFWLVSMIVWLVDVASFFVGFLFSHVSSLTDLDKVSGIVLVFGYAIFLVYFKFESIKSKKFFQELLEAREVEEMAIANPFETAG